MDKCQEEITKQAVQIFGHWMQQYILTYLSIEKAKEDQASGTALEMDGKLLVNLPEVSCQACGKVGEAEENTLQHCRSRKEFYRFG